MGIAIAEALAAKGADVDLVLGPTHLRPTRSQGIRVHAVQTAQDMFEACAAIFPLSNASILAAAVADYRPATYATRKIKKNEDDLNLPLARTIDIAATLGAQKRADQLLVGFALETNDEVAHAQGKLTRKHFDFIVLNSLRDEGAGFGHDTNKIAILHEDGRQQAFPLKAKSAVAEDIVSEVIFALQGKTAIWGTCSAFLPTQEDSNTESAQL